ncbi:protein translocase subunit SecDF [Candidatus Methylacidiphilum fumarolicum]|uniref:Multifunctional fusion protein n=2 Tax=Candidatus Methylacidiphilum fumarolicum TaxID=591154 RepID=I0JZ33_METFB|nr:protein translocase subunit SecDF [Candidatus Methylacidiphilum fumarolicum]MBW6414660.1 protein translocase subunit SecDF [Candidatus Methylacidiphilum fumarolicum]TFE65677.1 preprotein translocase subunit SecD [Candidatus Methylacidiphilum fumarolicum]TFE74230.1 protein translocase subunit SecDF [Candidatus Methylacidiphilum fumarolicum]TFE75729.1 protein translocase subunit SecDF [Candidatus Methylacidiphilum fumarolicum]TFE75889.1 preprotein translocase subunit SecD [Candidatus Methylac
MLFFSFATALFFLITLIWYFTAVEDRIKRWVGLASTLSILFNAIFSLYPLEKKIRLGLDLKGGTAFLLELQGEPTSGALDQAIGVIRKRVDKFGLSEPIIQPVGKRRISVQIPGLSESEKAAAKEQLSKVAKLEFRLVHPDSDKLLAAVQSGQEKIPPGYEILPFSQEISKGNKTEALILVKKREEMGGKYVKRAFRGFDEVGRPTVVIEFNEAGAKRFGEITSNNIGKRLAIVLDGEVKSAPVIQTAIFKSAVISGGNMSPKEAEDLASVLENPLETPVKILEERGVDPSLGRDSIVSGINAALAAFASVVLFMVFYYRLAGLVSIIALLVNLLLLLGLLAQFHFTLTLPGIAGIILTIGMAVDANVLIYERIRDELEVGVPVRQAIFIGFNKAFSAIFDSNVSLIIPSVILMELGSGPLQGFAVTLVLGIVANLFAALVLSRNVFEWLLSWGMLKKLSMMKFLHKPNFDFIKFSWLTVPAAAILLIVGMSTFFLRSGELLGVDFAGGDALTVAYKEMIPVASVRQVLEEAKIHPSLLQYAKESKQLIYQVRYGEGEKSVGVLKEKFPHAGFSLSRMDSVGPVVGEELKNRAALALSLGLLAILLYVSFRYEWSFALAAGIGQLHDVLLAIGLMAIFGKEFDMYLIGAFLTILGYSINEKIVISDRIRETLKYKSSLTFKEIINEGINKTLARTIMTGGTVVLATVSMLLLGGPVISVFSLAILIGVLGGMFSSHFISPALLYWFHRLTEKRGKKIPIQSQAV